jgi:tetratricopeptide (TPR) repeat protein
MSRRTLALLVALLAAPRLALGFGFGADENDDGGQPGAFLEASANARPLAMGGAHTAIAEDATAPFWNASGLAQIQRYDMVAYFSRLGADANIGSGAFALPTRGLGTFGVNMVALRSGSFDRRDGQNRDLGEFENNASALMLSQAGNFGTRWSLGYTLKAVRQDIAGFSDTGYGADLGVMMRPGALWQVGLALQNLIQPSLKLKDDAEKLPTEIRLGGRFEPRKRLTLAADFGFVENRAAELSLGTEWRVSDPLALRIGANDREITAGVGVTAGDLGVDYAFGVPHASVVRTEIGSSHRLSFHLRFGTNVMAGSYRDLASRREEQRQAIIVERRGADQVDVLKERMAHWNGRMDVETFQQVQAARGSLRELAFRDPMELQIAQAYVSHFQGRFQDSARMFDRLVELNPRDRRLRRDAEIALQRAEKNPGLSQTAQMYDRMDTADRHRREQETQAIARAAEAAAVAGGAGSTQEPAVEERGEAPLSSGGAGRSGAQQVAFLPPGALPPAAPPPSIRRQAPPPPVAVPRESRPEPSPRAQPRPAEPEVPARPARTGPPAAVPARPAPSPAVPPQPTQPEVPAVPTESPQLQEARRHFEEGDYVESHLATKRILEANPNDRLAARQSMLTSSVVAAQATIVDPKETVNVQEIEGRVDKSLVLFDQGMQLYRKRKRDEAVLIWERAVEVCPANFLARNMIGRVNQELFDEKWNKILNRARG